MVVGHPHRDFWIQVGFVLSQIGLAFWQAGKFTAQIMINHTFWACAVAAEILLLTVFARKRWSTGAKLVLERFLVFAPVLNIIRGKPLFYTNASGSWLDRVFPKTAFTIAWCVALLILIRLFIGKRHKAKQAQKSELNPVENQMSTPTPKS